MAFFKPCMSAAAISAAVFVASPVGHAQEAPGLRPAAEALLRAAAAGDDPSALREAVRLLLAADPGLAATLRRTLVTLVPQERVDTLSARVPALAAPPPTATPQPVPPVAEAPVTEAIAPPPPAPEPEPQEGFFKWKAWEGEVKVGGSASTGDVNEQALSLVFEMSQVIADTWDHSVSVNTDYSRNNSVTNQQRLASAYELFYRGWDNYFLSSLTRVDYDRFGSFLWRITEAPSVGWTIYNREKLGWSLQGGPGIRFTNLAETDAAGSEFNETNTEFVFRLGSNFDWALNGRVTLSNDSSLFTGPTTTTAENEIALTSDLTDRLSAAVSFNVRWDSQVPEDTSRIDTLSRFSLGYKF
ncbi:hypothetical protein CKO24_01410 [Rhodothalassium salexigens DSM 2132]|nr:hypothetical protein [Rhodothalassium salexigens DSM 2132]